MITSASALGIRGRLWLAFGAISALPIVAALVAWVAFADVAERMSLVADQRLPQIETALRLAATAERLASYGPDLVAAPDADRWAALWQKVEPTQADARRLIEALRATTDASEITDYISYIDDMARMLADIRRLVDSTSATRSALAETMLSVDLTAQDFDQSAARLSHAETGTLLRQLNARLVTQIQTLPAMTDPEAVARAGRVVAEQQATLARLVGGLSAADQAEIAPPRDAWVALLASAPFQKQTDLLLDGQDRDLLLVSNATIADRLRDRTAKLVAEARAGVTSAAQDVRDVITQECGSFLGLQRGRWFWRFALAGFTLAAGSFAA